MRKIISISLEEKLIEKIDEARGIASRSRFIETILEEWDTEPEKPEKTI